MTESICLPTLVSSENNNKTPSLTRSANIPTQKGALSLSLIVVPYQSGALAVLSVSRPPVVPRALDATESSGQSMGKGRVYCPPLQPKKLFLLIMDLLSILLPAERSSTAKIPREYLLI
jgi:hypothetical protein